MRKPRIKVGLLGAGYILDSHAKALQTVGDVALTAVCDVSRGRAEQAARKYGVRNIYTSLDAMLESSIDVVHVLLPPYLHEDAAEKIIRAGKSVFLEKPMGLNSKRCESLVELARDTGVRLGVNHNFLFTPAYESLRESVKTGKLGKLDHVTIHWLYPLGSIQLGPYNNWMFRSPENLLFELAPHAFAYALDLLGPLDTLSSTAGDSVDLPGHQRVYRHWLVQGNHGRASCAINLSVNPGQPDRSLCVRGSAATARLDYERGIWWMEKARTNNALFDNLSQGRATARAIGRRTRSNYRKYLAATLRKAPGANVFGESIQRSIRTFYGTLEEGLDSRLDGAFGVEVIRTCERSAAASGALPVPSPASPVVINSKSSDTLVVGGTGFIGKRLVAKLLEEGRGVRVLTRSRRTAELELEGLPVDIVEGHHGDPAVLDRILPGIRIVYHLAKAVGEKWSDYYEGDVRPTEILAEACLRHNVSRFIYTGTIDSYRSSNPATVITGETPLDSGIRRRNHYARSKAMCEDLLMRMHREKGLPLVVLRPGIVIGKGSPPAHWGVGMFLSDSFVKYWGAGDNVLPFVLVDDVAQALALAGTAGGIEGRTFLLTDKPMLTAREYIGYLQEFMGTPIRQAQVPVWRYFMADVVKELVKNVIRHPNRKIPSYRDWACRSHRSVYDSSTTINDLGWKPSGDKAEMIEKGIKAAVEYYYR